MRPLGILCLGLGFLACSRTPSEPAGSTAASAHPAERPAAPRASGPTEPAAATRDVIWTDPTEWQRVAPSSAMRKASYKVRHVSKDTEDPEVAVFYFGSGEGGGTEANIARWTGQFANAKPSDVKRTERTVNGMHQTVVEIEGVYASGMPGADPTPKGAYRLLGAIVETPKGSYFFKMTGPKDSVSAARDTFYGLLDSVRQG